MGKVTVTMKHWVIERERGTGSGSGTKTRSEIERAIAKG